MFDLETRIAAEHWDRVRMRDASATYNRMTWTLPAAQELRGVPAIEIGRWKYAHLNISSAHVPIESAGSADRSNLELPR
ncbi:hypothetical protein ACWIGI_26280 [Nocardia sp. NPDC055321]